MASLVEFAQTKASKRALMDRLRAAMTPDPNVSGAGFLPLSQTVPGDFSSTQFDPTQGIIGSLGRGALDLLGQGIGPQGNITPDALGALGMFTSPLGAARGGLGSGARLGRRGKTREEIEIQGGPLATKLDESQVGRVLDEHGIDWNFADDGGITAVEVFTDKIGRVHSGKKHFRPNTSLRTIRNWLGY